MNAFEKEGEKPFSNRQALFLLQLVAGCSDPRLPFSRLFSLSSQLANTPMEPPAALLAPACGALDRLQACLASPVPQGLPAALDAADTVAGAVAWLRERPDDPASAQALEALLRSCAALLPVDCSWRASR